MRLVAAADEDVKEPGIPNSVKKVRQAYVRAIAEYRKRTDPSFTPAKPTKFENWPLGDLINEVRQVECMLLGAPLLPADLKCQMHVAILVAGTALSAEVPGKESLSFVEKFDQHLETRKRYDAWKEKQSKQSKQPQERTGESGLCTSVRCWVYARVGSPDNITTSRVLSWCFQLRSPTIE